MEYPRRLSMKVYHNIYGSDIKLENKVLFIKKGYIDILCRVPQLIRCVRLLKIDTNSFAKFVAVWKHLFLNIIHHFILSPIYGIK